MGDGDILALIPLIKRRAEACMARRGREDRFSSSLLRARLPQRRTACDLFAPGIRAAECFLLSPGAPFARIGAAAARQAGSLAPTYARARTSLALARNEATRAA
jgi:hypothetical protein